MTGISIGSRGGLYQSQRPCWILPHCALFPTSPLDSAVRTERVAAAVATTVATIMASPLAAHVRAFPCITAPFMCNRAGSPPPPLALTRHLVAALASAQPLVVLIRSPPPLHSLPIPQAEVTPSLKNLLNSFVAGGVVLAVIASAVTAVSNFDQVTRD